MTKVLIINLTELFGQDTGKPDSHYANELYLHCCDLARIGHWPADGVTLSDLHTALHATPCFRGMLSEYLFIGTRQDIMDAPWLNEEFAEQIHSALSRCHSVDPRHMFWVNTDQAPDVGLAVPGLSAKRGM